MDVAPEVVDSPHLKLVNEILDFIKTIDTTNLKLKIPENISNDLAKKEFKTKIVDNFKSLNRTALNLTLNACALQKPDNAKFYYKNGFTDCTSTKLISEIKKTLEILDETETYTASIKDKFKKYIADIETLIEQNKKGGRKIKRKSSKRKSSKRKSSKRRH
jgi:hypothetical protein